MSPTTLELDHVSLRYRLATQRIRSLKEYAVHWVTRALTHRELWALNDVSLRVTKGASVGIVGRNGAGKSTLLKVISGVLAPTRGQASVTGTVAPLLELGTGFDHELTGSENIYLNALLLGHPKREIRERVPEIVQFSELGDFIDSPIRHYSSGMLARLAFSVLTAWRPDLLLLDEVFAVGDAGFIEKCRKRINAFRAEGTSLLLVSHVPEAIRSTCDRCIWLDQGRVVEDGTVSAVLEAYRGASSSHP